MHAFHLVTAAVCVTVASASVISGPKTFELLILHNNDMHARFEQTSQHLGTCNDADKEAGKCYGGFARVAHVVKEARAKAASGEGPPVLYLNAGDTYTGTAWFTIYKWEIAAEFINALQPDAMSLGNNEIEKGSSELSPLLRDVKPPIIVSNINLKQTDNEKLRKSLVIDIEGHKVGVVGYLKPDMSILDSTDKVEYIDEILALKEEVAKLQEQNVNIIIALGHANYEKDLEIANEVDGIDIVIGGHKNVFFWNGTNADPATNAYEPEVITQQSGRQVLLIQSHAYNQYFGGVQIQFNEAGEIVTFTTENMLLDASVPQDTEIVELYSTIHNKVSTRSEDIIGSTAVVLDADSCRAEECNLGNLITDAMMYYYAIRFDGERWTDAPIAVIPSGHLGASISPANRPADITLGDLMTALPTESQMVTVTMPGAVFLQMLEHSVSNHSRSNPTGQLLQMSGVRVVYDLEREPGSRVVSAVARCWACFVPEFYIIDDRDYKILMPESLANGEYGYSMLTTLPRENLVYDEITCASEFIELRSPVYPEVAGRILLLNDDEDDGDDDGEPGSATVMGSTVLMSILLPTLMLMQNIQ